MKIRIQSVVDKGDLDHERLVFRVLGDLDLGDFMLVRTGFEDDQVTTEILNTFWFPYKAASAGDIVVVYSKTGGSKQKPISDDRIAHFFYWCQDSPLWDDDDVAPVLLYAPEWVSKAPQELAASSA